MNLPHEKRGFWIWIEKWVVFVCLPFISKGSCENSWWVGWRWDIPLHRVLMCTQSQSHVQLLVAPWTIAHQAPLSMGFFRQEYWSGLPFPPPGDLPDPGIEPSSLMSTVLAGGFFTISTTWKALYIVTNNKRLLNEGQSSEGNWRNYFKGTKRYTDLWPWQPHNAIPWGLRMRVLPWLPEQLGCSILSWWGCQVGETIVPSYPEGGYQDSQDEGLLS